MTPARFFLTLAVASFFVIVYSLFLFLAIIFYPYRLLVWAIAKCWLSEPEDFAHGMSALFLLGPEEIPFLNIMVYFVVDGEVPISRLQEIFQEKVLSCRDPGGELTYRNLRSYFRAFMGYNLKRRDRGFNLREHVRLYDYGGDIALGSATEEKDLRRVLSGLIATPWRKGKSPWELLLIPSFKYSATDDTTRTVLVLRFDHGLGDGYSILTMCSKLLSAEVQLTGPQQHPVPFWKKMTLAQMVTFPFRMFFELADQHVESYARKSAWVLGRNPAMAYHSTVMDSIPIGTIKAIKNKYRTNYNAILLAGLSGGIYRVMKEAGQEIPEHITVFLPLPRANHPGGLLNHMDSARLALRIRSMTPADILYTGKQLENAYVSLNREGMALLFYLGEFLPNFIARFVQHYDIDHAVIANVPIQTARHTLDGHLVSDMITSMASTSGIFPAGAVMSMGGYNGKQRMSVTIDKSVFPSGEIFSKLGDYIKEEILSMLHD